jgi:hypothetical protein
MTLLIGGLALLGAIIIAAAIDPDEPAVGRP